MQSLPFYIFLFIHLVSLITGFGAVIVIDMFGLLAVTKRVDFPLVDKVASVTQRLIWLGWCGLVASGIGLITIKGYIDNLTWIKLFFVAMLGLNGVYLHIIRKASRGIARMEDVSPLIRFRITMASIISQTGWWGALFIGFIHRHWRHEINWPQTPFLVIAIIALVFGVSIIVGETTLRKK